MMVTDGIASNPDTSNSEGAQRSFATRVGNAFAALDDIGKAKDPGARTWQLHESLVFRQGDGGGDSSEDDEREGNVEWEEDLMDLGSSEPFVPTGAFCRALDKEEEFDQSDDLAAHSLHVGAAELMPAKHMEVRDSLHAAMDDCSTDSMQGFRWRAVYQDDLPHPYVVLDDSSYERAYAGCRQAVDGTSKDPVMATAVCSGVSSTPAAVEGVGNGGGGAGALSAQRGSTVHGNQAQTRTRAPSRIPDYVAHPKNYKCYELDEPLVVGGGVQDSENQQAYCKPALQTPVPSKSSVLVANPAELAETQDSGQLPVGSGIEFRPRLNRKTVAGAAGTASTGPLDLNDGKGSKRKCVA